MQTLYADIANHADALEIIESGIEARFISASHDFDITGKFNDEGEFCLKSTKHPVKFTQAQLGDIIMIASGEINEQDFINVHGFSL